LECPLFWFVCVGLCILHLLCIFFSSWTAQYVYSRKRTKFYSHVQRDSYPQL
jgi:hypothetical protein